MSFDSLGLSQGLLSAVTDQGYNQPTPIQAEAIPAILNGHDVQAAAQTGTGKTAAFTLPLLHKLMTSRTGQTGKHGNRRVPSALILVPTRELASQVGNSIRTYGHHLPIRSTMIFGGAGMQPQVSTLRKGVDVIVATPGRLMDHINRGNVDLGAIETLVLDEADRMLDMGFIQDIRTIIGYLPRKRQNLMFSATFSNEIRKLAGNILNQPVTIDIAPRNTTAERVEQHVYEVDKERKRELLEKLIVANGWGQTLIFTRTKHGADKLTKQLTNAGLRAAAIHGNKSQNARTRALSDFRSKRIQLLIATDIAARGLDIEALPHVVNYELPQVPEDYIHRIGRTGRAQYSGNAISLVSSDEYFRLKDIEKILGKKLTRLVEPGFEVVNQGHQQNKPAGKSSKPRNQNGRRHHAAKSSGKSRQGDGRRQSKRQRA